MIQTPQLESKSLICLFLVQLESEFLFLDRTPHLVCTEASLGFAFVTDTVPSNWQCPPAHFLIL